MKTKRKVRKKMNEIIRKNKERKRKEKKKKRFYLIISLL